MALLCQPIRKHFWCWRWTGSATAVPLLLNLTHLGHSGVSRERWRGTESRKGGPLYRERKPPPVSAWQQAAASSCCLTAGQSTVGPKGRRQFRTGIRLYPGIRGSEGFPLSVPNCRARRGAASQCSQVICKSGFFSARKKEGVTAPHDKPNKRPATAIILKARIFSGLSPIISRTFKYLFRSLATKSA
jgi:hypothetical protein